MHETARSSSPVIAVLLAAGSGSRAGGVQPKQFQSLAGRPVIAHALTSLLDSGCVSRVLMVGSPSSQSELEAALAPMPLTDFVGGGARRQDSVAAAITALDGVDGDAIILIHDAARPFIPADVVAALVDAIQSGADGAFPALPVADTVVEAQGSTSGDVVPRETLRRVQTPQAFRLATLRSAHRAWPNETLATDCAQMVRAIGGTVRLVAGDPMLEKITYPEDFVRAEARLAATTPIMIPCMGTGYDVHRLVEGKELWLCGVLIPSPKGLSGHSDADVALHALVDAILGAIADGDIGQHFPPSNPQWKGARSDQFLSFAVDRVRARGGRIAHVDVTIICEAPRIGPHRDAMRLRLSKLLGLGLNRISVKATTTERLGFTGRGEGIAAQAAATVLMPAEEEAELHG